MTDTRQPDMTNAPTRGSTDPAEWQPEIPKPWSPNGVYRLGPDMRPRLWCQEGKWCMSTFELADHGHGLKVYEHGHTGHNLARGASWEEAVAWATERGQDPARGFGLRGAPDSFGEGVMPTHGNGRPPLSVALGQEPTEPGKLVRTVRIVGPSADGKCWVSELGNQWHRNGSTTYGFRDTTHELPPRSLLALEKHFSLDGWPSDYDRENERVLGRLQDSGKGE